MTPLRNLILSVSLFAISSNAFADGPYVGGALGWSFSEQTSNSDTFEVGTAQGLTGSLFGGYKWDNIYNLNHRLEFETNYRSFEMHGYNANGNEESATGDLNLWSNFVNYWAGYNLTEPLEIYAGGGVGFAVVDMSNFKTSITNTHVNDTDVAFSWQVGAGFNYKIDKHWVATTGYRYMAVPSYSFKGEDGNSSSHSILTGVIYNF